MPFMVVVGSKDAIASVASRSVAPAGNLNTGRGILLSQRYGRRPASRAQSPGCDRARHTGGLEGQSEAGGHERHAA